jgi:serine/threonine-protein kinase
MNRLTFDGNNLNPIWSPDGSQIYYSSSNAAIAPGYKALRILRKPSDGTGQPELVLGDEVQLLPSAISPDGHLLAVDRLTGASDLYLYSLDSSEEMRPFVTSSFDEWMASFSPDGKWLAYVSDESNSLEIYVRPVAGTSGKWQISSAGGTEPHWSSDGTELFYLNVNKMMRVSIDATSGFRPGTPEILFEIPMWGDSGATSFFDGSYDIAPDARRFLMIQPEAGMSDLPLAAVVLNWTEELKKKVPLP